MSDSQGPPISEPPASREERLTRIFYDWERRGRGWAVRPYPVELEPPLRPVYYYDSVPDQITDDGRIQTFWSRLFGSSGGAKAIPDSSRIESEFLERLSELDEPAPSEKYDDELFEIHLILPENQKVGKPFVNQLVASASYCTDRIAFEVVGNESEVVLQMAATARDLPQLRHQLAAYFPEARFRESEEGYLRRFWEQAEGHTQIVDFGLSDEFMIPLDTVTNLDLDPLVSIVGALADLECGEVGVFQVLFQRARHRWESAIMEAVRFEDGRPVFADAPELLALAKQKVSRPLFAAVVRIGAKADDQERLWQIVRGIAAGMAQLSTPTGNELIPLSNTGYDRDYHEHALLHRISFRVGMILNLDELISLVHPPTTGVRSQKLIRETSATKAAPSITTGHRLVLGENEHRDAIADVSLSNEQRTRHVQLIGSSGSGKSTLLLNLIRQDLENGDGLCLIDPHGDLIDSVIENFPDDRAGDAIVFDPSDSEFPIGFNILQAHSPLEKNLLSSDLVATFRRMATSWGDVMDSVLANAILAFLESTRGGTLFDLKRFLVEKEFREEFLYSVTDDGVVYFWENEFPLIAGKPQASILIRLDAFLRQSLIRNIVCQKDNKLDLRGIMDDRKVLLVKLSQGLIGEENAYLLGTMLVSRIYQSALSRQESHQRPYFWLYLDEFHHFITPSMERILSGTRKYNLGLVLAHQEFRQMQSRSMEVASSVLSNCYTRICFRLGDNDAEKFAGGFSFFDAKALQNLGIGEAIARVERAEYDFNLRTTQIEPVAQEVAARRRAEIVSGSRNSYARPRSEVEQELRDLVQRPKKAETKAPPEKEKAATPATEKFLNAPESPKPSQPRPFESVKRATPFEPAVADDAEIPISEKRSHQHRYIQTLVKRMAEEKGFRVTIEKSVLGGTGKVDVALERESVKIACEISVTNEPGYELQNLQKCLAAGFHSVILISADERHLARIGKVVEETLTSEERKVIQFLSPEEFHSWLETLAGSHDPPEETIKGYKIKTKIKAVDEAERKTRKQAISEVVFGALKRLRNKKDDK